MEYILTYWMIPILKDSYLKKKILYRIEVNLVVVCLPSYDRK